MRFVSTRGTAGAVSFCEALFRGLAADGGLYMPVADNGSFVPMPAGTIAALRGAPFIDVANAVLRHFLRSNIESLVLYDLVGEALNFPVPLIQIDDDRWVLELFHGPTFAFKDVAARVMARLMAHFNAGHEPLTILVATSGDTGSAVAHAFFNVPGTRIVVLFPHGQVSPIQEAQFSTLGGNVTALAVEGTFDDCQRLVKEAFADPAFSDARLSSANSINIARLLPQVSYYVYAALAMPSDVVMSVPSGNFGNLTAGLMAKRLGAPIEHFVAATTINDTVPRFLATGRYQPRASVATLANAMDVGDPSNAERMRWLYGDDLEQLRQDITSSVHRDNEVRAAIEAVFRTTGYVCDPHTAIAYLGSLRSTAQASRTTAGPVVFLATAHPAKFREVVEPIIGQPIPLPPALEHALAKPRQVVRISADLASLRRAI